MKFSEDAIQAKFPWKSLAPIVGEPDYISLHKLRAQAYSNASAIPSRLGGGNNGHLGVIMPDATYFQKTGAHFIIPAHPGTYDPAIANNATNAVRARAEADHEALVNDIETAENVALLIKNQIIAAVEETYIDELNDPDEGYLHSTPIDLMDHLFDRYGLITETMITENKAMMDEPFDPTQPFATYTKRIEKAMQLADDAGTPYSDAQLVQIGIIAMTKSGIFTEGYLRWNRHPNNEKTWANFKTHFNAEHTAWKNLSKMLAKEAGFGANQATINGGIPQGFAEAFDNLAMAAATDKTTFESLTNTIKALQQELSKTLEDNRRLLKMLEHGYGKPTNSNVEATHPGGKGTRLPLDPNGYCWTHGFRVSMGHDGHTCTAPADGHKREAKRGNIMGGNKKGIPKGYKE